MVGGAPKPLADLKTFRASLKQGKGRPATTIDDLRRAERACAIASLDTRILVSYYCPEALSAAVSSAIASVSDAVISTLVAHGQEMVTTDKTLGRAAGQVGVRCRLVR
jgi:hypothetical protein